jgi:hypothetical protein
MKKQIAPGITLGFHHWHDGNDPGHKIRGKRHPYATTCIIKNENTGVIYVVAKAVCSKKDAPTRAKGREISEGRALKMYAKLNQQS